MEKFTKGPLFIHDHPDEDCQVKTLSEYENDPYLGSHISFYGENHEANANLMRVAPEMYKALKTVIESIAETGSVNAVDCINIEFLLAKARGE